MLTGLNTVARENENAFLDPLTDAERETLHKLLLKLAD